jgi:UrcA family protein
MKTPSGQVGVSRPKVTLMMIMCGIVGAVSAGAVSAATTDEDVPTMTVRYSPSSLDTDQGAKVLYRRLVSAAVEVCPQYGGNPRWVTDAVRHCREQAIANAVFKINNPRLAAVHATNAKNGKNG